MLFILLFLNHKKILIKIYPRQTGNKAKPFHIIIDKEQHIIIANNIEFDILYLKVINGNLEK